MEGWIKLHRKLTDWEWYNDLPTFKLFMHLLLTVNYQPTRFKGDELEAGTLNTTLDVLAEGSGLTKKQVRRALANLESTGEITQSKAHNKMLVKVLNFSIYQSTDEGAGHTKGTRRAHEGHTKGTQRAHEHTILKEIKNKRNKEIKNISSECERTGERTAIFPWAENVLMTDEQACKLIDICGSDELNQYIENLNEYIEQGHTVHNPYETILRWKHRDSLTIVGGNK